MAKGVRTGTDRYIFEDADGPSGAASQFEAEKKARSVIEKTKRIKSLMLQNQGFRRSQVRLCTYRRMYRLRYVVQIEESLGFDQPIILSVDR